MLNCGHKHNLNVTGKICHLSTLRQSLIPVVEVVSRFKRIGRDDGQTADQAKCSIMNLEQTKVKDVFPIFVEINDNEYSL